MIQLPFSERIEIVLSITGHVGSLWILRGQGYLVPEKERKIVYTSIHDLPGPNLGPQTDYYNFSLFIPVTPGEYRNGASNQNKTQCFCVLFNNAVSNFDVIMTVHRR